jgi:hypothetical protein
MNDDRRLERAARSWIEAGPTQAPERAVEAALRRIETTHQDRDLRVPWRTPSMPFRIAAAAAIAVALVGGALTLGPLLNETGPGVLPSSAPPATLDQLNGPILAKPLVVPEALLVAAERTCRNDPDFPGGTLVLTDARGGGILVLYFLADERDFVFCPVTVPSGSPQLEDGSLDVECCAPGDVALHGLDWVRPRLHVAAGRAGSGIAAVRIELEHGQTVVASLQDSWFSAYWNLNYEPGALDCSFEGVRHDCPPVQHYRAVGLDAGGSVVGTLADRLDTIP